MASSRAWSSAPEALFRVLVRVVFEPHLQNRIWSISFQTYAELCRWAVANNSGQCRRKSLHDFVEKRLTLTPFVISNREVSADDLSDLLQRVEEVDADGLAELDLDWGDGGAVVDERVDLGSAAVAVEEERGVEAAV